MRCSIADVVAAVLAVSSCDAGGTAAILPDGRTFFGWSYVLWNGTAYTTLLATP